jgi:hypothetical protein
MYRRLYQKWFKLALNLDRTGTDRNLNENSKIIIKSYISSIGSVLNRGTIFYPLQVLP